MVVRLVRPDHLVRLRVTRLSHHHRRVIEVHRLVQPGARNHLREGPIRLGQMRHAGPIPYPLPSLSLVVGVRGDGSGGVDVKHLHRLVNRAATNDKAAKKPREELRRQRRGGKHLVHLSRVRVKLQDRDALLVVPHLPSIAMISAYSNHVVLSSGNQCAAIHSPRHAVDLSLR